jgi:hypothetical protein
MIEGDVRISGRNQRTYNGFFSPKSCYPRDQGLALHDRLAISCRGKKSLA